MSRTSSQALIVRLCSVGTSAEAGAEGCCMNKILALCLLVAVASTAAADLSGAWRVALKATNGDEAPTFTVTLKQDGQKLSGTCATDARDEQFTVTGQVTDSAATWRCARQPLTVDFSGKISASGSGITGSWSTSASGKGTFTAQRRR